MNNRKVIPMSVPAIGNQQQIQLSEADTIEKHCPCGGELFDIAYRLRTLPAVSPKNPTGKDMPIKVEVFVCRVCGREYGREIKPEISC